MKKQLLIIGLVWPEPNSSAAGTRMLQLLRMFKKQDFTIVFASAAQESNFSFDLNTIGVRTQKIELNSPTFDAFVKELNPEIVVFDRYISEEQFGWRVAENCPKAVRILDTEDLHCLRLERQMAVKKNRAFENSDLLDSDVAKREIASMYRCDLNLMISEFEIKLLQDVFNFDISLLFYLPLFYSQEPGLALPDFNQRKDFVFIGNFLHEPNWDAVKLLKEKIWPQLRKLLPEAKMNIYGAYPSQKVWQLDNKKENFIIHGRAESSEVVLKNAKVLLAPLRFGAGVKGKLVEAMQTGTPTVTSSIGIEGIAKENCWNGFVENDNTDFALKAYELYQNEAIWKISQEKGFQALKKFNSTSFELTFFKTLNDLIVTLPQKRRKNFIGNLLQHHSLQSVKFMSKWIEEKNKK